MPGLEMRPVWLTDRPTQTGSFSLSVWVRRGLRSVGLGPSGFSSPVGLGLTVRSRRSTALLEGTHAQRFITTLLTPS
jgi:hypothetical protein